MPNRILKESICISESIEELSWFEEVFFYRLMVHCDDYGRTDGRIAVLKSRLFPLKSVTEQQMKTAIHKLSTVNMVCSYEVSGKPYLQLVTWQNHQNVRTKKSKYPAPPEESSVEYSSTFASAYNCKQMNSDDISCQPLHTNATLIQSNPNQNQNSNPNSNQNPVKVEEKVGKVEKVPYEEILEKFNQIGERFSKIRGIDGNRKKKVGLRYQEYGKEVLFQVFELANGSDFLCGIKSEWKADFDWIIESGNFMKILEGKYENRGAVETKSQYENMGSYNPFENPFGKERKK